ncbi:MAG: aldehyde dehydrogenase family protein [candidate division KSB1 bacterium]|nr:aldehyde dehydrogenase family protein [candidate division KSB1 bacterium]MDZ7365224.1 aldehyde dehydrogenase family protein [candidate division KSB1 bacterium]MDZ7407263.1 aldehyde dehydrogenase family protein [candidate division KSB1 bacterium]
MPKQFKITYSTLGANLDAFHRAYDKAVTAVKKKIGKTYPHVINNRPIRGRGEIFASTNPADTRMVLANFRQATAEEMHAAVEAARLAFRKWSETDYRQRVKIMRKAAALIRQHKFELAAIMSLEAGKNRFEAMGDAEESADLIDYYCQQIMDAKGFNMPLGKLSPNEDTRSVLRPYGVWAVIAPFNFPLALSTGMSAGALIAGNTVVFKPSHSTPWIGYRLAEIYQQAGLPAGVFNFIAGDRQIGEELVKHPKLDGIVFTGSKPVGLHIFHEFSQNFIKPTIVELGGKNPAIVMPTADLDVAAEGVMKSAFGLQGQKCSACSRVYVHQKVKDEFIELLLQKTAKITIGDPSRRDIFLGPVINQGAYDKFAAAVKEAKNDGGTVLAGGEQIKDEYFAHGYFVQPTIVDDLPRHHRLFYEELFLPFLTIAAVDSLEEAVKLSNKAEYGLTAGIFTKNQKELDYFFNNIEAGVTYANRRSGATTGAWPGVNSFCGWKGSGSTGKGACGPYYVQQFMREQSRTVMK